MQKLPPTRASISPPSPTRSFRSDARAYQIQDEYCDDARKPQLPPVHIHLFYYCAQGANALYAPPAISGERRGCGGSSPFQE